MELEEEIEEVRQEKRETGRSREETVEENLYNIISVKELGNRELPK